MALLVSSWSNGVQSVPKDYVMPPEKRPGDYVTVCKEIPVINLQNDRSEIIPQILKACQEFGLFQGGGGEICEVRKMGFKILDLIGEGLGLNEGYFNRVSQEQSMAINHYPPCPDPSLAMGIGGHTDPNLITFLQQDQYGLQIQKDGKWMGIDPIPNAFVVNLGYQLQIVSNGKLKSAEHRGVLNSTASRTSIVTFFGPNPSLPIIVEPAKELVTSSSPQLFKSYTYNEFISEYLASVRKSGTRKGTPLDPYRL